MSLTYKQQAIRRLKAHRQSLNYDPRPGPSESAIFNESPVLYYQVYDSNLAPVRKGITYAHSLEELAYMALDNTHRLGTFDELFETRPNFSARNLTIRDLILTTFVGTSDGKVETMLVCPYQGESAFDLDTTLYATVASDLVPNSRGTPLRIALNVPAGTRKWSAMAKPRFFGTNPSDSLLHELNNRVNLGQVVELRNDPEGSVRYSQKVLDEIKAKKNPPPPSPAKTTTASPVIAVTNGSSAEPPVAQDVTTELVGDATTAETLPTEEEVRAGAVEAEDVDKETGHGRAPIALATSDNPVETTSIDVSSITAPLQASKLEDNTTTEIDALAVESNESNPVFDDLDRAQIETADVGQSDPFKKTKALSSEQPGAGLQATVEVEEEGGIMPALEREEGVKQ